MFNKISSFTAPQFAALSPRQVRENEGKTAYFLTRNEDGLLIQEGKYEVKEDIEIGEGVDENKGPFTQLIKSTPLGRFVLFKLNQPFGGISEAVVNHNGLHLTRESAQAEIDFKTDNKFDDYQDPNYQE